MSLQRRLLPLNRSCKMRYGLLVSHQEAEHTRTASGCKFFTYVCSAQSRKQSRDTNAASGCMLPRAVTCCCAHLHLQRQTFEHKRCWRACDTPAVHGALAQAHVTLEALLMPNCDLDMAVAEPVCWCACTSVDPLWWQPHSTHSVSEGVQAAAPVGSRPMATGFAGSRHG